MADYNIQMKQYNGTSFDNILPHAYLADTATELAGGWGATEIIAQARAGLVQVASGQYVGTGTSGVSHPTVIFVGFKPRIFIVRMMGNALALSGGAQLTLPMIYIKGNIDTGSSTYIWTGESFAGSYINRSFINVCQFVANDTEMRINSTNDWENAGYSGSMVQFNSESYTYSWLAFG